MTDIVLQLRGVSRFYGGVRAVEDVTLEIERGERLGLIGPNGAGKTTLVRLISGEVRPSRGSVTMSGGDVTTLGLAARARLGLARTFQITELFPALSVIDNLRLAAAGRDLNGDIDLYSLAAQCGIADSLRAIVSSLAYGRQRQVELAMALAQRPQLLLLDEPAAGLDAADRLRVAKVMKSLDADLTTVLIEHDVDLVVQLCTRVVCLAQGKVVADATPDRIVRDPRVRELYLGGGKAS